jgi:probable transglycosylase isaA
MKFGKVITAAAASGVLLSGAFMIAEEYTGHSAFAVTLSDNTKVDVKAKKGTVREILAANNISYNADDRVEPGLDTKVNGGEDIRIYKAREITIQDGETTTVRKTTYKKVEDILKELNITVGAEDKVTPGLKTEVAEVDTIKIARVGKTTQTVKEAIKFETKEEKDDTKYADEVVTKTEGQDGEKEVTYSVVHEDGKEVSKEVVSERVITEPTAKVVVVGTKQREGAQQAVAPASTETATTGAGTISTPATSYSKAAPTNSYAAQSSYTPQYSYSQSSGGVVLSNGNTAGAAGTAAAQEMARRTGVSASTWERIIARESNGQVYARNASGASGLFQTMPGWGSTATVKDQINAAVKAYNAQGLSAWGVRR